MSTQSVAGEWCPHCSECLDRCQTVVRDYGFDYDGPGGLTSHDDVSAESDCCGADVVDDNPTCTRCDTYLRNTDIIFWTHGALLCVDCQHNRSAEK